VRLPQVFTGHVLPMSPPMRELPSPDFSETGNPIATGQRENSVTCSGLRRPRTTGMGPTSTRIPPGGFSRPAGSPMPVS
jgi:hypothetical protein